jgi:hypothetical protein
MNFGFENEEIMGKQICDVTYRQLVNLGAVLPYEILVLKVTQEDIKNFISSNTWVRDEMFMENEQVQSRFIASIIAADKAFKKGYIKRLLTFHSRINHAQNFEKAMINLKNNNIFTSFSDLDFIGSCQGSQADVNKTLLELLSDSNMGTISNARVLTEGVSIPAIDSVLFCDPKTSAADTAQGFSRAIRLMSGKEIARIIIPVIWNEEGQIDQPQFQPMIDIMDYIANYDKTLWEEINIVPQTQGRTRIVSSRIINTTELEIEGVDINEFYNEISLAVWNRVKTQNGFWDDEDRLREYAAPKNSRNELLENEAALRRLEANDYKLWKKLCPHIPLPRQKKTWEEKLNEVKDIALNYKGTYEQFRKDHYQVYKIFTAISEMVSSPYNKTQELIDEFCKHMPRGTFSWKYASSEEVINKFLSKCKTKSDTKQFDANIKQKLSKWPQLSEALNYYNNLC